MRQYIRLLKQPVTVGSLIVERLKLHRIFNDESTRPDSTWVRAFSKELGSPNGLLVLLRSVDVPSTDYLIA